MERELGGDTGGRSKNRLFAAPFPSDRFSIKKPGAPCGAP
jgi:hypothetical protein